MDNEQLLDRVQNLILGLEQKINSRFDGVDARFDGVDARFDGVDARFDGVDARFERVENRLQSVETKLDSMSREVTLNNQLLAPFIAWSHRVEDEVIRLSA